MMHAWDDPEIDSLFSASWAGVVGLRGVESGVVLIWRWMKPDGRVFCHPHGIQIRVSFLRGDANYPWAYAPPHFLLCPVGTKLWTPHNNEAVDWCKAKEVSEAGEACGNAP